MPWLMVNHTRLCWLSAVPMPLLALEVQRGEIPGQPGAKRSKRLSPTSTSLGWLFSSRLSFSEPTIPALFCIPLSSIRHLSWQGFYQVSGNWSRGGERGGRPIHAFLGDTHKCLVSGVLEYGLWQSLCPPHCGLRMHLLRKRSTRRSPQ